MEPFLPCLRGSFTAELSPRLEEAAKGERKVFFVDAANTVELLFLPAYSPNLNLIERLWKHLKKKSLKNKHFIIIR